MTYIKTKVSKRSPHESEQYLKRKAFRRKAVEWRRAFAPIRTYEQHFVFGTHIIYRSDP